MSDLKIVRMFGADQERICPAEIAAAMRNLSSLSNWHAVQAFPGAEPAPDGTWQFPRLRVGWSPEADGYFVQWYECAGSRSHFLVAGHPFSEPEIRMAVGFLFSELWPKECFVPYGRALQAALHFIETRSLDPSLPWVGLNDFPRRPILRGIS
jgi:hypothetical protein